MPFSTCKKISSKVAWGNATILECFEPRQIRMIRNKQNKIQ